MFRRMFRLSLFLLCVYVPVSANDFPVAIPANWSDATGDVPRQSNCTSQDLSALRAFRSQISNFNQSWWSSNEVCCDWEGVKCGNRSDSNLQSETSVGDRVVSLSLPYLGLRGHLTGLSELTSLRILNLSGNFFHGTGTTELLSLGGLQILDLSMNNLSGSVSFLGSLSSLRLVNVSSNYLTGRLPSFKNLTSLEVFSVSNNSLEGPIDSSICKYAPRIGTLEFSNNRFTALGIGLGNCGQLRVLDAGYNNLTGPIPDDLVSLGSLLRLSLKNNRLSETLPDGVGRLANITELLLGFNNFSGSIPRGLSNCSNLKLLALNSNNLSGIVNLNCEKLQKLTVLDLNTNNLNGVIPSSLAGCFSLQTLNLAKNRLVGEIPVEFNRLRNLRTLSLSTNQLNGSLTSLMECTELVSLVLSKNVFTHPLPQNVIGFFNLQVLALGYLNLVGTFPTWLSNCTKLQVLDLSWNKLRGPLPEWIGGFQHLFYLDLSNNSFEGTIPPKLFELPALMHNDLNTTDLKPVVNDLAVKRQQDSPDLQYTQVTAFPPSLYLSHNNLTGSIPGQVGNLKKLLNLDLSYNKLNGNIPIVLASAALLESLDLSVNLLTGSIPVSLSRLTFLSAFNVSFNELVGMIPQGNQFPTFTEKSFEGNLGLCGSPLNTTCCGAVACKLSNSQPVTGVTTSARSSERAGRIVILTIPISVGFAMASLLVAALWILSRQNMVYHGNDISRDLEMPQSLAEALSLPVELFNDYEKLTVADLFKATNNFDSSNIIGCGGFGLVYRADLGDGSKLAIKKLTGDCGQMEREFRAEVEALSKAQHKNLVSLQGYIQVGNDRLLLYSYMENGSLDYWLHERGDGATNLDWPIRLKIAQGAACGLGYLHQICNPHIVHRDIKSSNILLDEKFEAHLADFGLARLMVSTDTHVTTELVGTLGYIPPEYGQALNATLRGDVYSFGVVVLELLTRKRPVDICKARGGGDLVAWVRQMMYEGKSEDIFDSLLRNKGHEEWMLQVLEIACLCINQDPMKRPTIKDVAFWLDEIGLDSQLNK